MASLRPALLLSLVVFAAGDDTWEARTHHGHFTFIFHDTTNLLLVQTTDTCYVTNVPDGKEALWARDSHRQELQGLMLGVVKNPHNRHFHESSLQQLRNNHGDLLADIYCVGKDVNGIDMAPFYEEILHPTHGHGHGDHDD